MSTREAVIAALLAGDAPAEELLRREDWMTGPPPPGLLEAWTAPSSAVAGTPLHAVALAWEREAVSAALIETVRAGADGSRRESAAWLLKDTLAPAHAAEAIALAGASGESPRVRRWLTEGLARLAAGGRLGWPELSALVPSLAADSEPEVRGGAVGMLMLLPASEQRTRLLLGLLADPDSQVLAGAVRAAELDAEITARIDGGQLEALLRHPHPLVRSGAERLAALRAGGGEERRR